jgi:penicillin-binding protein 1A
MDVRTVYLMTSLMQDVILRGTGRRAAQINRADLAGKTGTTNGLMDAWFAGYTPDLVTVTWVGFDQMRSLGPGESGGATATPIWANYMEQALKNVPIQPVQPPPGVNALWISSETGRLTTPEDPAGRYEYFRSDMPPAPPEAETANPVPGDAAIRQEELRELF